MLSIGSSFLFQFDKCWELNISYTYFQWTEDRQEFQIQCWEKEKKTYLSQVTHVFQGWTGVYTLVAPSLSAKVIKNSHQNLSV